MRRNEVIGMVLLLFATLGPIVLVFGYEGYRQSQFTAELIALTPEQGNWQPLEIRVSQGEDVRILLRNADVVTHSFVVPELDIHVNELKAGHSKIIEFTPQEKGEFSYLCTIWCSPRHPEMVGKIIVE